MRVVQLAAGAGGMICGSCMKDNRLAATLLRQGRDVVLLPLYTPLKTDEIDVSTGPVYYGGISVYLRQKSRLFRGLPSFFDKVLNHPLLLRAVARVEVKAKPNDLGALTVSVLRGAEGSQAGQLQELLDALRMLNPYLVHLPDLMFLGLAGPIKEALRIPVVCSLSGEDIFLDVLPEPFRRESFELIQEAALQVDAFLAPSRYFEGHAATHFHLPRQRIRYVPMGISVDDVGPPADPPHRPFTIGYFARICPEKGLAVLGEAFARLRAAGRNCLLRAGGYLGAADRPYFREVAAKLKREGCEDAFDHAGELSRAEKIDFLRSLHVLSVPTVYREAKGLYVLEALACGVPVVQPRHGSFPELMEATGGGVLVEPNNPAALAEGLAGLMDDEPRRRMLADQGRRRVRDTFTDAVMAEQTWQVYEALMRS